MDITTLQQQLFQAIKNKLPAETSLADELAGLLQISSDSAYRRMRGEKLITFEELYTLGTHYRISLDQLMGIQTEGISFQGKFLDSKTFKFDEYLTGVMHQLAYINSFKEKEFFYLCKESPMFHHFYFRELAAFKYFAWLGALLFFPEFRNRKVSFEEYPENLFNIGEKILGFYDQIDSVEIWNMESLHSTIRQVEFYRDANLFHSDYDVLQVYNAIEKMMDHLEKQAELGYKFKYGDPERKPLGRFRMYFNEVVIGDNHMLGVMDGSKVAFIPHSAANYLMTRDVHYCENFYQYLQNLMRRSTLISEVSEKERSRFFKIHRERIGHRKQSLKV